MQRTFEMRQQDFKQVKTRICSILLDYPSGLTHAQILQEYMTRFRHSALLDNRLRELRAEGEVMSFSREGCSSLLWQLNPERWRRKEATT